MARPASVDEYLAALSPEARAGVETLRRTIRGAAPDAVEGIAYDMPAYRVDGKFLVSCAAFKKHFSLFPASAVVVERLGDEVRPYVSGKGTFRFPADRPIPTDLVTKIVKVRLEETAATAEGA